MASGRVSAAAAGALIATSYLAARTGGAERLDAFARSRLARPAGDGVDRLVGAVTDLGSVYGLAGLAGVLAASGHRRTALDVAGAGLVAWTAAQAAKPAVRRTRPYEGDDLAHRLVAPPAGSSWPSGHSAVTAAMATELAAVGAPAVAVASGTVVVAVAASRIYAGVHHLSDVVAGVGVGMLASRLWHGIGRR